MTLVSIKLTSFQLTKKVSITIIQMDMDISWLSLCSVILSYMQINKFVTVI